jgi:hypothetical protein
MATVAPKVPGTDGDEAPKVTGTDGDAVSPKVTGTNGDDGDAKDVIRLWVMDSRFLPKTIFATKIRTMKLKNCTKI